MSATAAPVGRLVDQFEHGLDAPICLTWELTYACNLACVHCLSSSGRRDPRELSTAECKAVIDELQRMQVFYVNVGGGEPTVRRDFWELLDYATAHDVGREVLDERLADHARDRGAAGGDRLRRRPDLPRRCQRRGQRPRPRTRLLRHGAARDARPRRRRLPGLQDLGGHHARERGAARPVQGHRRRLRRAVADHASAPLGPRRGRLGRTASHRGAAARALRLAARARRGGADRRLVLPPRRLRRSAAGTEPVRGRPRGLPHRSRRRRVRVPVRDPRRIPAPATFARTAASPASGASPSCSSTYADRRRAEHAPRVGSTTRAAAAAWPRSSSLASRSTARTRSARSATANRSSPPGMRPRRARRSTTRARPPPDRACDEDPLADFWRDSVMASSQRLVRVGRRGAAAGAETPAQAPSTTRCSPGAERGATLDDNVAAFGELGFVPRIATGLPAARDQATTVLGQQISMPVLISPTGVQAVQPGRRGRRSPVPRRRRARRWVSARSRASRSRRSSRPTRRRSSRCTGWAPASACSSAMERPGSAGAEGAHRDARLDVRPPPRLGQSRDPRTARPARDRALRAARDRAAALAARVPAQWRSARPHHAQPRAARRRRADVLRRLRRVDADAAALVGGYRLAARAVGRPVPGEGRDAPRRRPPRRRGRRRRDLGLQPRRQQPRQHARRRSARCPRRRGGRRPRSRSSSTAGSAAAATSSRRSRSVPARCWSGARICGGWRPTGEAGVGNVLEILRSGIDEALVGLGRASIHELAPDDLIMRPAFVPGRLAKLGEAASPLNAA